MLKDIPVSNLIFFKFYCGVFILIGVFMTITAAYNSDNILSYAKYNVMKPVPQLDILEHNQPNIIFINDNQSEPTFSEISSAGPNQNPINSNSNNSNTNTFTGNSEFRKDITGKYTNPKYGITNFEIPSGWFATESMNGDKGIVITVLPATTEEFFSKVNSLSNNETLPVMNLIVQDREDLRERQMSFSSLYNTESSSSSSECTELASNSTTTINDKQFQISTMKCSKADNGPIGDGIDFSHEEIIKSFKYDLPSKMYILQLLLSSDYSSNKIVNDAYLSKFQPVLDDAIHTLKIK